MNPDTNITFACELGHGETALLPDAIAGAIRPGWRAGTAPGYAWVLSSQQAGLS